MEVLSQYFWANLICKDFVFLEGMCCFGSAVGPGIGSFVSFRVNIFGWKVNEGNSPGIVLVVIWLIFVISIFLMPSDIWMSTSTNEVKMRTELEDKEHKDETVNNEGVNLCTNECSAGKKSVFKDSRIYCTLFLVFSCHVYSSTTTFFAPILALDHFHLELIHTNLLFVNGAMFTLLALIGFFYASEYLEERTLYILLC